MVLDESVHTAMYSSSRYIFTEHVFPIWASNDTYSVNRSIVIHSKKILSLVHWVIVDQENSVTGTKLQSTPRFFVAYTVKNSCYKAQKSIL